MTNKWGREFPMGSLLQCGKHNEVVVLYRVGGTEMALVLLSHDGQVSPNFDETEGIPATEYEFLHRCPEELENRVYRALLAGEIRMPHHQEGEKHDSTA